MASGRISTGTRNGILDDLATRYDNCVIGLFGGAMPASADLTEGTTLLGLVTLNSGAFVAGAPGNGLGWNAASGAALTKADGEVWSCTVLATGVVTWCRVYANDYATGASTTADRIDLAVATSGAAVTMSNTSVTIDKTATIDNATITCPAS